MLFKDFVLNYKSCSCREQTR